MFFLFYFLLSNYFFLKIIIIIFLSSHLIKRLALGGKALKDFVDFCTVGLGKAGERIRMINTFPVNFEASTFIILDAGSDIFFTVNNTLDTLIMIFEAIHGIEGKGEG